ncbi:MAG: ECF transporter S component [Arthrobacter sp.]|uniref:ECF transporter S component n=1 Tax=unclassified Arthrobacter TaxID=235627 RepID=UPI00264F97F4|nr:ECF transporter S component [Micrococcaceae bacterium]MDN5812650.1 ECF transporter S component [Micrococcaceae bacterium]MDN5822823.1 ECF transporter S component [Micrococcaceae bacterium]MDN5879227.1 ECF transporter S component [Micrococcaceae bacterium]MDN5887219.1 ECF transporter S component [Micrococcaceae bacterium]
MSSTLSAAPTARYTWRVVDIVVASVIAVASGVIFWAWNTTHHAFDFIFVAFPPSSALLAGMWLFPAVLGALIIRKPGAALFCEMVAAVVSSLLGSEYGWTVWASGIIQGLGAEIVFAVLLYRRWSLPVALFAGLLTGIFGGVNDAFVFSWFPDYTESMKLAYVVFMAISGLVIAGLGSWALTRALSRTGALSSMASRKAAQERVLG